MQWYEIHLNDTDTGYVYKGYNIFKKYDRAMSFHAPGVAAVYDTEGAYHIQTDGEPLYNQRYLEAYGYYDGLASVKDQNGFFHIDLHGTPVHNQRFHWSGNYQEERCVVTDGESYFHIDKKGKSVYSERYTYCGDYRYGIAVAYISPISAYHIDKNGKRLNQRNYRAAGQYHKGFAVVRDDSGFFHVNKIGNEIYKDRFFQLEDFYNGWAFAEDLYGKKLKVSETGEKVYFK